MVTNPDASVRRAGDSRTDDVDARSLANAGYLVRLPRATNTAHLSISASTARQGEASGWCGGHRTS